MPDLRLPGLTKRAAEALKPFVDHAMQLERGGCLDYDQLDPPLDQLNYAAFRVSAWRELLAALRESQEVAEGIRLEREAQ